ncbi:MAG: hypothetical protein FJ189_02550 [Gammaproteobacteria bacterium]|nr:hypothetical protein [Gammaproteobacteria bacterium]
MSAPDDADLVEEICSHSWEITTDEFLPRLKPGDCVELADCKTEPGEIVAIKAENSLGWTLEWWDGKMEYLAAVVIVEFRNRESIGDRIFPLGWCG